MDKKFISGTVFGLVLGLTASLATPMLGAKDIVLPSKKTTTKKTTTVTNTDTTESNTNSGLSAEAIQLLKEINNNLKDNSNDNKQIIEQLHNLNKKQGL